MSFGIILYSTIFIISLLYIGLTSAIADNFNVNCSGSQQIGLIQTLLTILMTLSVAFFAISMIYLICVCGSSCDLSLNLDSKFFIVLLVILLGCASIASAMFAEYNSLNSSDKSLCSNSNLTTLMTALISISWIIFGIVCLTGIMKLWLNKKKKIVK